MEPKKVCSRDDCELKGTLQLLSEFSKDIRASDGHYSNCKTCSRKVSETYRDDNRESYLATMQKHNKKRKESNKQYRQLFNTKVLRLAARYSLPLDLAQKFVEGTLECEICKSTKTICVDHCHETGIFRAPLCRRCNSVQGFCNDDPKLLEKHRLYAEKSKLIKESCSSLMT